MIVDAAICVLVVPADARRLDGGYGSAAAASAGGGVADAAGTARRVGIGVLRTATSTITKTKIRPRRTAPAARTSQSFPRAIPKAAAAATPPSGRNSTQTQALGKGSTLRWRARERFQPAFVERKIGLAELLGNHRARTS